MTQSFDEKRANPRIQINGELSYLTSDSEHSHGGILEDISLGGARIWIDKQLPQSSQLLFRVESEGEDLPLEFVATLLRILPERKQALYGYGCTIERAEYVIN